MRKVIVFAVVALFAVLMLTASPTPTSAAGPVSFYSVRYGDTMNSIANRYGISTWALARANGVWTPDSIYAGQGLYIPCAGCWYPQYPRPVSNPAFYPRPMPGPIPGQMPSWTPGPTWGPVYRCSYVVRYGDNLSTIAYRFGVDAWTLARYNGIYNMNWIYAGQWLRVPGCSL